jgi:hypothetical protein
MRGSYLYEYCWSILKLCVVSIFWGLCAVSYVAYNQSKAAEKIPIRKLWLKNVRFDAFQLKFLSLSHATAFLSYSDL